MTAKYLKISQFGNPVLRQRAQALSPEDIAYAKTQKLISDMRKVLVEKKLGVGLAAPQVGESLAVAVIAIRPTDIRPKAAEFDLVIINPEILETKGYHRQAWEGCISAGSHGKADLFAKVPRYKELKLRYQDEKGTQHNKVFRDLQAQVIQHEVDHLNGVLFVDRVKDTSTYKTYAEYMKATKKSR